MRQQELASIVSGLKSEFSKTPKLDRKSIGARANSANLAALDMLLDGCEPGEGTVQTLDQARSFGVLANELQEITGIIGDLAAARR
jgi:hypothetical protein